MISFPRLLWLLALILIVVALDHATKYIAIQTLGQDPGRVIAFPSQWHPHDLFRFQYAENTGAFLSLGSQLSEGMRFGLLVGLNSLILLVVTVYLVLRPDLSIAVAASLALLLGGGIGNLIDRVFRDGRVVDFMNLGIGFDRWSLRTGIFNIADLAIVFGLLLLIVFELFGGRATDTGEAEQQP
jgi:signal peptidase II